MVRTLILLNLVIVLIWDVFRAPDEMAGEFMSLITGGKIKTAKLIKPFGCSLCMTFWLSLILTFIFCERSIDGFMVSALLSLFNAFMTKYTYQVIILTERVVDKIIYLINEYI